MSVHVSLWQIYGFLKKKRQQCLLEALFSTLPADSQEEFKILQSSISSVMTVKQVPSDDLYDPNRAPRMVVTLSPAGTSAAARRAREAKVSALLGSLYPPEPVTPTEDASHISAAGDQCSVDNVSGGLPKQELAQPLGCDIAMADFTQPFNPSACLEFLMKQPDLCNRVTNVPPAPSIPSFILGPPLSLGS